MAARGHYRVSRGDKAGISGLDLLIRHLRKVRDIIDDLPLEAEEYLERVGAYNHPLPLEYFERRALAAKERLEEKPLKKRGGRPESKQAFEVAREALYAYEVLTGTRAGITTSATEEGHPRSGAFLDFLAEIFKALDITASAESQAKKAIANRTSPWLPDDQDAYAFALGLALGDALKSNKPVASFEREAKELHAKRPKATRFRRNVGAKQKTPRQKAH